MASERSDTSNGDTLDQVCRDFLRNVCRRGKKCKYLHPNESEQESLGAAVGAGKKEYVFCHDYQNTQCTRLNCRFIHCTREEEHFFKLTGELPEHVLQDSIRKGITIDPSNPGNAPVCKDYLKGSCRRAGKCKFRHLTLREYEIELGFHIGSLPSWQSPGATTTVTTNTTTAVAAAATSVTASRRRGYEDSEYDYYGKSSTAGVGYDGELGPPEVKRRHIVSLDPHTHTICIREEPEIPSEHVYPAQAASTDMTAYHTAAPSTLPDDGTTADVPQAETEEQKIQVAPPEATAASEYYPDQNVAPTYDYETYGQCYCCYSTTCYNAQHWSSYYAGSTYYTPDSTSSSPSSQPNGQYWQNSQHTTSHSQC